MRRRPLSTKILASLQPRLPYAFSVSRSTWLDEVELRVEVRRNPSLTSSKAQAHCAVARNTRVCTRLSSTGEHSYALRKGFVLLAARPTNVHAIRTTCGHRDNRPSRRFPSALSHGQAPPAQGRSFPNAPKHDARIAPAAYADTDPRSWNQPNCGSLPQD